MLCFVGLSIGTMSGMSQVGILVSSRQLLSAFLPGLVSAPQVVVFTRNTLSRPSLPLLWRWIPARHLFPFQAWFAFLYRLWFFLLTLQTAPNAPCFKAQDFYKGGDFPAVSSPISQPTPTHTPWLCLVPRTLSLKLLESSIFLFQSLLIWTYWSLYLKALSFLLQPCPSEVWPTIERWDRVQGLPYAPLPRPRPPPPSLRLRVSSQSGSWQRGDLRLSCGCPLISFSGDPHRHQMASLQCV